MAAIEGAFRSAMMANKLFQPTSQTRFARLGRG